MTTTTYYFHMLSKVSCFNVHPYPSLHNLGLAFKFQHHWGLPFRFSTLAYIHASPPPYSGNLYNKLYDSPWLSWHKTLSTLQLGIYSCYFLLMLFSVTPLNRIGISLTRQQQLRCKFV